MNKIKFIRYYKKYNMDTWEIIYKSGRVKTIYNDNLPMTAQTFCIMAKHKIEQIDKYNGLETIWTN